MEFLINWFLVASLVFVAIISPGPDFVVAVKNSVLYNRRIGIFTALGFAAGVCIHVLYCSLGIAAIISQSIFAFNVIKYLGAAYLIYIGFKALRSKGYDNMQVVSDEDHRTKKHYTSFAGFRDGFFTNLFNPKTTIFFLALFTQVIDANTSAAALFAYGLTASIMTALWFSFVAVALNQRHVRRVFLKGAGWIDRVCGSLMIIFGIRLAFTKMN